MRTMWKPLTAALALALAVPAFAQQSEAELEAARKELAEARKELAEASKRFAELAGQLGDQNANLQMFRYLGDPDRAVVGVILGDGDANGVRINGVTPDGPADLAGLRAGDVVVAVRGAQIAGEQPSNTLREALKGLKEGDRVPLTYLRDGKRETVTVTAKRQGDFQMFSSRAPRAFVFEGGDIGAVLPEDFSERIERIVAHNTKQGLQGLESLRNIEVTVGGPRGLRLSTVNKDLGTYFGVSEGALVLDVDDSYKGLKAGDVILEVDGQKVTDPRAAMRELRKHGGDRPVELKLQRERVPQLVKVTVPERNDAFWAPPAPPAPPVAPTPPVPPAPPERGALI